jgi:hypothetical protein
VTIVHRRETLPTPPAHRADRDAARAGSGRMATRSSDSARGCRVPDRPLNAEAEYGIAVLRDDGSLRTLTSLAHCENRRESAMQCRPQDDRSGAPANHDDPFQPSNPLTMAIGYAISGQSGLNQSG